MSNFISNMKKGFTLLFKKSSSLLPEDVTLKKRTWGQVLGLFLILVEIIIAIVFLRLLFILDVVPGKYMAAVIIVIVLITAYNTISQFFKASHIIGKILSVVLSVALLTGSLYVSKASSALDSFTGTTTKKDTIDIIVLESDSASILSDLKSYTFGFNALMEKTNAEKAIAEIDDKLDTTVQSKEYDDWSTLINDLYNNKIGAILMNDATRATLIQEYTDFDTRTKIIDTISITTKITLSKSDKKVNSEPFTVFISGNDQYGDLAQTGLSDVNIIATVNPKTRQVILVSTPRDYYVPITSLSGITAPDKLTHAGNYGVDGSMTAIQKLYGVDLDYYVKLNFTGTVGIVDALGGITVDSEVAFTTTPDTAPIPYTFDIGENEIDGERALAFCRERQAFGNGDNQRGRNQMIAMQSIISKVTSSAILSHYNDVLDSISNMFATSMPPETITALIKGQLNNSSSWNVQTYNVEGTSASKSSYLFDIAAMDVLIPNYSTVNLGIEMMSKIENDEIFDVNEYVEAHKTSQRN